MSDRLRRLRRTPGLRNLVRETRLRAADFIYPIFVSETATEPEPIPSMPGQSRLPLTAVAAKVKEAQRLGLGAILFFGLPREKDDNATSSCAPHGIVQRAIRTAKEACPEMVLMTDVCVCAYTPHGHCGVLKGHEVDNDETLRLLANMAVSHAEAGADVVAPSSMMDRQVGALREALDERGFMETAVMGYSAKFASAYYGPFRDAADSAPSFGDRASYQHDPANIRHARREILADEREGADILMVKPGIAYLDVVRLARETSDLPIAAYNVSGEYSMIKAAAERGWLDERKVVLETLTAFRRAGADLVITYHALDAAKWLNDN
ncbi:porphobilinogen synthase [Fimbriimonas ginsengisoli]|uniref:Delta-aminolevulinic acid dehydratase n=1 Tax=Fimbriimonas ginsengisoli Gsoil 348 TaxID=661478 RepID=A0A068NLE4_FIMGI|nr:porphobilinogen synthase [Fimbriimonas ginsengisoli]AIE84306.1 Porphobilinogen synthase [Fimbriimonas ginsengisoli Gsoil 348]